MEFDTNKYRIYTWKSGMMLHWIINPGLAFNELALGQRVPKVTLIDKTSEKPYLERGIVPCPHCGALHDGRIWSTQNGRAFKNWFGLYCPDCGQIIPCLRNATSWLILALTSPIWWWFKDRWKAEWLSRQPERYRNLDVSAITYQKVSWLRLGIGFGAMMFILMGLLDPWISGESITGKSALRSLIVCSLAGLFFALTLKWWMSLRGKPNSGQ